ncbi:MAG: CHC2 zinc finger domain-containing protein [SAR324 cluster bacterium]|nr:CHC2 zinc finger domain-containing protein [SAR324 cluster bacterium]
MAISRETVAEVKRRADIVQIIGEKVSLTPSGSNFKGLCPFHSEKTPSFMVNPQRGMYH